VPTKKAELFVEEVAAVVKVAAAESIIEKGVAEEVAVVEPVPKTARGRRGKVVEEVVESEAEMTVVEAPVVTAPKGRRGRAAQNTSTPNKEKENKVVEEPEQSIVVAPQEVIPTVVETSEDSLEEVAEEQVDVEDTTVVEAAAKKAASVKGGRRGAKKVTPVKRGRRGAKTDETAEVPEVEATVSVKASTKRGAKTSCLETLHKPVGRGCRSANVEVNVAEPAFPEEVEEASFEVAEPDAAEVIEVETPAVTKSSKRGLFCFRKKAKEVSKDETITKSAPRGRRGAKAVVEPAVDATPSEKHAEFYEVAEELLVETPATKAKATMKVITSKAVVAEVAEPEVDVEAEPTPKPIKGIRGDKKAEEPTTTPKASAAKRGRAKVEVEESEPTPKKCGRNVTFEESPKKTPAKSKSRRGKKASPVKSSPVKKVSPIKSASPVKKASLVKKALSVKKASPVKKAAAKKGKAKVDEVVEVVEEPVESPKKTPKKTPKKSLATQSISKDVKELSNLGMEAKDAERKVLVEDLVNQIISSRKVDLASNCNACGLDLAIDETLFEHQVSKHLTVEGTCDICGEDSEDFIEHFKIHTNRRQFNLPIFNKLENDEEAMSVDENKNSKDTVDCENDEERPDGGGSWVANPFFSPSEYYHLLSMSCNKN